jgi:hypothetical protein
MKKITSISRVRGNPSIANPRIIIIIALVARESMT